MIRFDILHRVTGSVLFTAEIDCDENTSRSINLGLAVMAAVKVGANLDEANLVGASLYRATLVGAKWGFARPIAIAARVDDPYQFTLWRSLWGGHAVKAGCRLFSISEYRAHVAREYPGTDKAAETLAILDYLEARLTALAVAA
jgi:hypothetical protein